MRPIAINESYFSLSDFFINLKLFYITTPPSIKNKKRAKIPASFSNNQTKIICQLLTIQNI
ncbi:MAG: hypothetical protein E7205_11865 [Tissierellaceae bacterium]|nr:hypothetical protein [Tissierellaceae bacterium]